MATIALALSVGAPAPAMASATQVAGYSLSVSPGAGPVGSVVTVSFAAPPGAVCGDLAFAGSVTVQGGTGSRTAHFVVPTSLVRAPVVPGTYAFTVQCERQTAAGYPAPPLTVSAAFVVTSATVPPSRVVGMAPTPDGGGYWLAQAGGGVYSFGDAAFHGSLPQRGIVPASPIVGIAADPRGGGYWLAAADGGVFSFGGATFFGSLPQQHVTAAAPIVGITADPRGGGYWLVAADGGVFAFGSAPYLGAATQPGNGRGALAPYVGLAATADGGGYDESVGTAVTAVGFGDVHDGGNPMLALPGVSPSWLLTGMAVTATGDGAWFAGGDGGVFAVAASGASPPPYFGSLPGEGIGPAAPVVGIAATPDDGGYWLVGADGGVFPFGDAGFHGSAAGAGLPWQ